VSRHTTMDIYFNENGILLSGLGFIHDLSRYLNKQIKDVLKEKILPKYNKNQIPTRMMWFTGDTDTPYDEGSLTVKRIVCRLCIQPGVLRKEELDSYVDRLLNEVVAELQTIPGPINMYPVLIGVNAGVNAVGIMREIDCRILY